MIKKQLPLGLSMAVMNSIVSIGSVILQSSVNNLGSSVIAGNAAARILSGMFMQPMFSIAIAVTTFVSQSLGAKKYDLIKKGIQKSLVLSFTWAAFVILLSYTYIDKLLGLLVNSNQIEVINISSYYLRINSLFYFILAILFVYRNALQGLGSSTVPIISSFIEMFVKVIIAFYLTPKIGYLGVCLAEPLSWVLMTIVLLYYFFSKKHSTLRKLQAYTETLY